ncbi:MAG: transglutaminase domain-containing protein [Flavisolibacter sp.]
MKALYLFFFSLLSTHVFCQEASAPTQFGKISVEELQKKTYSIDTNASAVVLSDVGEASVDGNSKGWFSIVFKRHRVVHILNKNGFDEADVSIPLYSDGEAEEKLDEINAVTYNLENGKIQETKLESSSIFKNRLDKNHLVEKFTMPNVKEGCIIEIEYKLSSDFIEVLDPWLFQGSSPVLWSEYKLSVPQFFIYSFISHGYHPMYISERKDRVTNFTIMDSHYVGATDRYNFFAAVSDYRWVMKDVPEIREESFTSTIKNHLSGIEFELSATAEPLQTRDYKNTWEGLTKILLNSEYFGRGISNTNNWLSGDIAPIISGAHSELEKAQQIFDYVRDNFTCTNYNALFAEQSLKNTMKARKGTVSDINLLLTAMLRYAGLSADPVIISTTGHGYVLTKYPMFTSFNYVIVRVLAGGSDYYVDASRPRLGFNHLLPECYNGHARIIDEYAQPVYFHADSLKENTLTTVVLSYQDKGSLQAEYTQTPGYFNSYRIRDEIRRKGRDEFFKQVEKDLGNETKIKNAVIDSLDQYDFPITLKYQVELPQSKENVLYINPMFGEGYKTNPFVSAVRSYPVEMPYTMDNIYLLTLQIPSGYTVEELPAQDTVRLDGEGGAEFAYSVASSGNTISIRSHISITRTVFQPYEYSRLREFFKAVVKKESEEIVLRKKA